MSMNFSQALDAMKDGKRIVSKSWPGGSQYVYLYNFANNPLFDPAFVRVAGNGHHIFGWTPTQSDMLAEDFTTVDEAGRAIS